MNKICPCCNITKEDHDFYKGYKHCKLCQRTKYKQWLQKNPEKYKKYQEQQKSKCKKDIRIRKRWTYGLKEEEFDKLYAQQTGKCVGCRLEFKDDINVDHNHQTGKIRGLLCSNCNSGLGMFKDDYKLLQKAIEYLKEHNG